MERMTLAKKFTHIAAIFLICCTCLPCQAKGGQVTPELYFDGQMLELGRAIAKGDTANIVAAINSGADPNGIGREGVTPLIFAFGTHQKKAMVTLLENRADPNMRITAPQAIEGIRGQTAVTIVAGTEDNEYLEILLDHGGDINAKNSDGEPILITMLFMDPTNYKGMEILLGRGADMEATDSSGATLLIILARVCDFQHLFYMLQRGADYKKRDKGGFDISSDVFNYKINKDEFPEGFEWQRKCKEFLLAHGVKDPGPLKPKEKTPEEEAEWLRMYKRALEEDIQRHGG
jgi:ankyrin repeat protein